VHLHHGTIIGRIDVAILLVAVPSAALIRGMFPDAQLSITTEFPYWIGSLCSIVLWLYWRPDRIVWRFRRLWDVLAIFAFAFCGPLIGTVIGFGADRLIGIPRSLPFIQATIVFVTMITCRFIFEGHHALREGESKAHALSDTDLTNKHLIIGHFFHVGAVVKLLQSDWAKGLVDMRVFESALTLEPGLKGSFLSGVQVLGQATELSACILTLENHGFRIKTLLVVSPEVAFAEPLWHNIQSVCLQKNIEIVGLSGLFEQPNLCDKDRTIDRAEIMMRQAPAQETHCEYPPAARVINGGDKPSFGTTRVSTGKRIFDVCASTSLLLVLAPLILLTSLLLKACHPSQPILFWQYRPGLRGKPFLLFKFRTLSDIFDSHSMTLKTLETRHSLIGQYIRKLRIDELPQLWNIFRGDMSFVGPRPLLPQDQPDDARRLMVKPGLIGWAQINGGSSLSVDDKNALDLFYIRHSSLMFDLKILGLTLLRWHNMDIIRPLAIKSAKLQLDIEESDAI
jgi:lipopolysaccharide/colanic/teichoic acid biosynthesis glycosyltransferase